MRIAGKNGDKKAERSALHTSRVVSGVGPTYDNGWKTVK
jgi:hypothetical protein